MSAYLVHPQHLHTLIWAGLHLTPYGAQPTWHIPNPEDETYPEGIKQSFGRTYRSLNKHTADTVGQILLDENARSVNHRYAEDEAYVYSYTRPSHTTWTPLEVLSAIAGYEYQACETPEWAHSEAHAICNALRDLLVEALPGFERGPWGIGPETLPQAEQAIRSI